jgi:small-conductance mechanosensitive channel
MAHGEMLGGLIRNLVITLTVLIGLEQLGLRLGLVQNLLLILAAAVMLSLALGFGLGAAPTVANLIAIRNVRRHYRVGQSVRVGDVEGVILELSSAFVVLDTDNGRTLVPARSFEEQVSTLLEAEGDDAG